jgi:hypothetical protein
MKAWPSILAAGLALAAPAGASQPTATSSNNPANQPQADRVGISTAIKEVYAVISGPAGQARDWTRMRSLFTPDARLYAITANGLRGGTVEDYIRISGPQLTATGFTEREIGRRQEIYGNLAHAWSSYEGASADGKMKVRGINSFQLVRQADGSWKIFSILWQPEGSNLPLPEDMIVVVR